MLPAWEGSSRLLCMEVDSQTMEQALVAMQEQLAALQAQVVQSNEVARASQAQTAQMQQAFQLLTGVSPDATGLGAGTRLRLGTGDLEAGRGRETYHVDAKYLQKPEKFTGDEAKWPNWSVLMVAYAEAVCPGAGDLMETVAARKTS